MKKTFIAGVAVMLVLTGCSLDSLKKDKVVIITPEDAQVKAEEFITKALVEPGSEVTVALPIIEDGLYKFKVVLADGREVDAYMSQDGKKFFPQALEIEKVLSEAGVAQGEQAPSLPVPKTDKPVVDLFIMSYCPYGTQIEKGIIPAVEALGNSIDFNLRFVSYAMHEKQEIDENLLQYCIQKEDESKLLPYLNCFLKEGKSTACLDSTGVNKDKVNACINSSDKEFKITENYNDKSTWQGTFPPFNTDKALNDQYGVQGSPTLIINGVEASAGRDSASLLKAICDAMNTPAEACSQSLSSATPAPGFGEGTTSGDSAAAGCGQ